MASNAAMKEARTQLGKFNTSSYDKLRTNAKRNYDTAIEGYNNSYNELINRLKSERQSNSENFAQSRGLVNDTAVLADRANRARRAAGGLSETDTDRLDNLMVASDVQSQYSNLADTFYNTLKEIDTAQESGLNEYNLNLKGADNDYKSALANISLAQQQAQNEYNRAVAQLAESIQSRWDAEAARQDNIDQNTATIVGAILRRMGATPSREELAEAITNLRRNGISDTKIKQYLSDYGIDIESYSSNNNYVAMPTVTPSLSTKKVKTTGGRSVYENRIYHR